MLDDCVRNREEDRGEISGCLDLFWNVWVKGGDETEGMRQELLSCTDGRFPEQKLLLCHFQTHTHAHTHCCVASTNEASLGTCGIRLQEDRLKVDSFIPRRDIYIRSSLSRKRQPLFPSCRPNV